MLERIEESDNFITICCDGIFDVMSNEEVVNYFVTRIPYKRHLKDLCGDLADYCCHKVRAILFRRKFFESSTTLKILGVKR